MMNVSKGFGRAHENGPTVKKGFTENVYTGMFDLSVKIQTRDLILPLALITFAD